jgi:ABC-type multidrug transport system fused ATPase/permease subunit
MSAGYRWMLVVAYILAAFEAAIAPSFSVVSVRLSSVLLARPNDSAEINGWILSIMLLGILGAVLSYLRLLFLNMYGTRLTMTLRKALFEKILANPASWFDRREGNQGLKKQISRFPRKYSLTHSVLLTRMLTKEVSRVREVIADGICSLECGGLMYLYALIISLASCWQLAV